MVVHTFSPSTQEAEAMDLCEFKASLVDIVSSRTARANYIVRPCWKGKKKNERKPLKRMTLLTTSTFKKWTRPRTLF